MIFSNDTTYNAYVDASGDDGICFNRGSTLGYTVAVLAMDSEDEDYNHEVLIKIKKLLGVNLRDEVKYSTLRRHHKSLEAHKLMGQVKGVVTFYHVFKRDVTEKKNVLTSVVHSFPIENLPTLVGPNIGTIFIDRMKSPEEKGVQYYLTDYEEAATVEDGKPIGNKVSFQDSKKIKMLQLVDFYAGAMRYFLEQYDVKQVSFPCNVCIRKKGNSRLCAAYIKKSPLVHLNEVNCFSHMIIRGDTGKVLLRGLLFDEPEKQANINKMWWVDCFLRK